MVERDKAQHKFFFGRPNRYRKPHLLKEHPNLKFFGSQSDCSPLRLDIATRPDSVYDDAISCLGIDGSACQVCSRELSNLYFRCMTCHKEQQTDCCFCGDCFLAHKFTRKHTNSPKSPGEYALRFRFFVIDQADQLLKNCLTLLKERGMQELPETDATLEYLREHALFNTESESLPLNDWDPR